MLGDLPLAASLVGAAQSFQFGLPDWDDVRRAAPLAAAGLIVWGLWVYRVVLSRRYRPVVNDFRTTTSVVVPSFHEDPAILMRCLESWLEQGPDEVIIVLDVADTEAFEQIRARNDPRVRPMLFRHAGKRSALGVGIKAAQYDLLVLTDSDTSWTPGLLEAVQMPFADPDVGAVGTQQNVWDRTSNVWRRIADWLVNLRYYDYVPAMGQAGAVACVSGRTGVYRRSVVLPVLENLENEFFMGRRCVAGDDGRLTWLVLASGYKTVHQSSAKALSMFPAGMKAFVKQRIRWSRNSYRCYLTAIYKGWLWRQPFVTKITVLQILLTPVTMGITIGYLLFSRLEFSVVGVLLAIGWLLLGRGIRGFSHLRRHPQEILLLPLLALVVIGIALPIKLYAFFTMNKQGWLTRHADSIGGEGQTSADTTKRAKGRVAVGAAVADEAIPAEARPGAPVPAGAGPATGNGATRALPHAPRPTGPHPMPPRTTGPHQLPPHQGPPRTTGPHQLPPRTTGPQVPPRMPAPRTPAPVPAGAAAQDGADRTTAVAARPGGGRPLPMADSPVVDYTVPIRVGPGGLQQPDDPQAAQPTARMAPARPAAAAVPQPRPSRIRPHRLDGWDEDWAEGARTEGTGSDGDQQ